jgi:hypothetical protein
VENHVNLRIVALLGEVLIQGVPKRGESKPYMMVLGRTELCTSHSSEG